MPRAHPESVKQLALTLLLQGFALPTIAEKIGVPARTVKQWHHRGQWSMIRTQVRADASKAAVAVVTQAHSDASRRLRNDLAMELQEQIAALRRKPVKGHAELSNQGRKQGRAAVVKTLVEAAAKVHGWDNEKSAGLIVPMVGRELPTIDVEPARAELEQVLNITPVGRTDPVPDPVQDKPDLPEIQTEDQTEPNPS